MTHFHLQLLYVNTIYLYGYFFDNALMWFDCFNEFGDEMFVGQFFCIDWLRGWLIFIKLVR